MDFLLQLFDMALHIDLHLLEFLENYGMWVYVLLFAIIFAETGFVITPFLPGDSLLFVAGTLAAGGGLDVYWVIPILIVASFGGDNANYWIGHHLGPRVFRGNDSWLLNREHLERAHAFYNRHGGKTVLLARFLPILRTFVPFVAGVGHMPYFRYLGFSFAGSVLWITLFVLAGYFFGHLPVVRGNLAVLIVAIIVISLLPGAIAWLRHRFAH